MSMPLVKTQAWRCNHHTKRLCALPRVSAQPHFLASKRSNATAGQNGDQSLWLTGRIQKRAFQTLIGRITDRVDGRGNAGVKERMKASFVISQCPTRRKNKFRLLRSGTLNWIQLLAIGAYRWGFWSDHPDQISHRLTPDDIFKDDFRIA